MRKLLDEKTGLTISGIPKMATVTVGKYISAQGQLVRKLSEGRAIVRTGANREVVGKLVTAV